MKISNFKSQISNFIWVGVWVTAAALLVAGIHPLRQGESIGGPAALIRGVLAGRDTLSHDYPAAWWGWSQVRETGNIPLWNPSWFCGEAFIASQTFMPFYPPNLLGMILPFPLAFNIQYPFHLILAALVLAWACRARALGWWAAGLAGLSWGFGSHLATLAGPGHIQKLQTLAWLPLVTTGAWRIGRGDARRGLLPFAAGLALQITAGHLQIVYLTLVTAALEALAGYWGTATLARRGRPGYVPVDVRLTVGGLALLVALGLSAVFWIPTVEFATISNRQGRLSWEDATRGSLPPEEAFEFALPRLRGDSMPYGRGAELRGQPYANSYIGRYGESSTSAPERVVSDYVGAGVLVFAAFALLARGRRAAWGYAALAAAALALSMGRYNPLFYKNALRVVPGLAHFRSPSTMMALLSYGLIMAAAIGIHEFKRPRRKGDALMLALAIAAAGLSIGAAVYRDSTLGQQARGAGANNPMAGEALLSYLRLFRTHAFHHTLQGCGFILGLAVVLRVTAGARSAGRPFPKGASIVVTAALIAVWGWDLLANVQPFWNAAEAAPYENFLARHWAMPLWARADEPVVRYLEVGNELSNRALTLSRFGLPAYLSLGSASGYHPVAYGKYEALQRRLGFLNPNFLRVFGVKYLLWPLGGEQNWPEGFKEYQRDEARGQILLYNPDNRYVREVEQFFQVKDFAAILDRLAKPGFNVYDSATVLEADMPPALRGKVVTPKQSAHPQTSVFALAPGETQIKATLRNTGNLAIAEPAVPGWRLMVDGVRAHAPDVVDGFCLEIVLPGGTHDVRLYYDPVSQRLGLFVTALTLGLAAFWFGRKAGHFRRT